MKLSTFYLFAFKEGTLTATNKYLHDKVTNRFFDHHYVHIFFGTISYFILLFLYKKYCKIVLWLEKEF